MVAILFSVIAGLAWGFSDFAGGVGSRSLRVSLVILISMLAACSVVVPVALLSGPPGFVGAEVAWAVAAGLAGLTSLAFMFASMAVGSISIVGPITACGIVIPVVVGLVRGETPSGLQLAGMAVAAAGALLASIEGADDGQGRRFAAGLGLAIGAAISAGLYLTTLDLAAAHDPYWAALVVRIVMVAVALPVALGWRRRVLGPTAARGGPLPPAGTKFRGIARGLLTLVIAAGLSDAVGEISFAVSTNHGPLSIVSVIGGSLYPAFVVVLAAAFIRERPGRRQLAGVAVAVLGIALIAGG